MSEQHADRNQRRPSECAERPSGARLLESMLVPVLAIFTALAVSAVLILLSDVKVLAAYSQRPQ